jgi:hypothetical protein
MSKQSETMISFLRLKVTQVAENFDLSFFETLVVLEIAQLALVNPIRL